jgi:HD-like signal output (HDOD) protein
VRVLLVEEDRLVARSLERLIGFAGPSDIELATASTRAEALDLLDRRRFEVVVSDMRNGTGAEVMKTARLRSPEALRLALSGHAEAADVVPLLSSAHQHVAKPLRHAELERVFGRLAWLRSLLPTGNARKLLHDVDRLPPLPATYAKLTRALASDQASANDIAEIIEQDSALSTKVLQLVGSSYFASSGCISDIGRAVVLVGARTIKALALAVEVLELPALPLRLRRRWQRHALTVANVAAQLTSSPRDAEHAFAAGLLHNVGELVLAMNVPEHLEALLERARLARRQTYEIEREQSETVGHPLLGAYLLGLWGLPRALVEAVLHHHDPPTDPGCLEGVVQMAVLLTAELAGDSLSPAASALDAGLAKELGVEAELPAWRALTQAAKQRADQSIE